MAEAVRAVTRIPARAIALLAACALCGCALPLAVPAPARLGGDERRALALLKQLYTLQMAYQAMNDRFAATTEQLKTVGWDDYDLRGYYPWMVHHGRHLCAAVLPMRRSLRAWSIDGAGRLYRGPYCGRLR
jgi:hypothetical protein